MGFHLPITSRRDTHGDPDHPVQRLADELASPYLLANWPPETLQDPIKQRLITEVLPDASEQTRRLLAERYDNPLPLQLVCRSPQLAALLAQGELNVDTVALLPTELDVAFRDHWYGLAGYQRDGLALDALAAADNGQRSLAITELRFALSEPTDILGARHPDTRRSEHALAVLTHQQDTTHDGPDQPSTEDTPTSLAVLPCTPYQPGLRLEVTDRG